MGRYVTDTEHAFRTAKGNLVIESVGLLLIQEKYASAKVRRRLRHRQHLLSRRGPRQAQLPHRRGWPAFWLLNDDPVAVARSTWSVVRQP